MTSDPLAEAPTIGDGGRQAEVVATPGPLTIGVSDTELDFFSAGPLEVRACSTRGLSHRFASTPRQDAFALAADGDWLVFALADGVSEGDYSQVAAETASRAACKLVLDGAAEIATLDWTLLAGRVSKRLIEEARIRRLVDMTDDADINVQLKMVRSVMSTTLVVGAIAVNPSSDGTHESYVVILAGDSGAYRIEGEQLMPVLGGKVDDGSGVSGGSVHPLPGASSPEVVHRQLVTGELLLLTSDGLGDPIGDGSNDVGHELARRWRTPPTIANFFADVNMRRRTYDDDRTAVGVWVAGARSAGMAPASEGTAGVFRSPPPAG